MKRRRRQRRNSRGPVDFLDSVTITDTSSLDQSLSINQESSNSTDISDGEYQCPRKRRRRRGIWEGIAADDIQQRYNVGEVKSTGTQENASGSLTSREVSGETQMGLENSFRGDKSDRKRSPISNSNDPESCARRSATDECAQIRPATIFSGTEQSLSSEFSEVASVVGKVSGTEYDVTAGPVEMNKTIEARRLCEVLEIIERGQLSRRYAGMLLKTAVIRSRFSYKTLTRYIKKRAGILAREKIMCRHEHAAVALSPNAVCPVEKCSERPNRGHTFYYRLLSEQIIALCREENSLRQLLEGCRRAQRALTEVNPETLFDFYDGDLFRRLHGEKMRSWREDETIFVFLNLSSDGFEVFKGRRKKRTAWPVLFTILNLDFNHRFRASNTIVSAFLPGTHTTEYFDSFIEELVQDLRALESGFTVSCADGSKRVLKAYVLFSTGDWPASSKMLGFVSHNGLTPCRRCHKRAKTVPAAKTSYMIPSEGTEDIPGVIHGQQQAVRTWLELECPKPRTDHETRRVWPRLEEIRKKGGRGWKKKLKELEKETGVKRRPIISKLSIDLVESVPYDPMHLVLSGWVDLLLRLSIGKHAKQSENFGTNLIQDDLVCFMNECLSDGAQGIPQIWGRPPESFEFLTNYKAEDFKSFALYYAPILFSGAGIDSKLTAIWMITSEIVDIVFDPTPLRTDCERLETLTVQAHALLHDIFYQSEEFSFCFPPNTHAFLHLGEMMRQCGPLVNVTQFTVERFVGEVGPMARSRLKPETNMFNKTLMLFSLRLLKGGIGLHDSVERGLYEDQDNPSPISGEVASCEEWVELLGKQKEISGNSRYSQARICAEAMLAECTEIQVISVRSFEKAIVGPRGSKFLVETLSAFNERLRSIENARQKCWIAAHFDINSDSLLDTDSENERSDIEDGCNTHLEEKTKVEVFYGSIHDIWKVVVRYKTNNSDAETEQEIVLPMAQIDWQYGLVRDENNRNFFSRIRNGPRSESIRKTKRTVERLDCIDRIIGYLDFGRKRYFLDPRKRRLENGNGIALKGSPLNRECKQKYRRT